MPKKTVREMNIMERLHHSLGGKTFRAILILSVILGVAAIGFGFFLYGTTVKREYRTMTWQLSRAASHVIDMKQTRELSDKVLEIYDSIPEEEKQDAEDADYARAFLPVQDEYFQTFRQQIHAIQEEGNAIAGYVAALDLDHDRMVFICDGDPNKSFCPPGYWDLMEKDVLTAFMEGEKVGLVEKMYGEEPMPSVAVRMERYGYRCTAGTQLFTVGEYPVFIFFDTDMNRVAEVSRTFLLQYIALLVVVAFLTGFFILRHLKKQVVKPINDLAEAAAAYTKDKRNEQQTGRHFENLNIHTGDEIENLSLTMKDMEHDLADYVKNLTRVTAEKERISTELDVASQIQEGMIPHIFPAFPERPEFDIYASMTPAKEVGGDFYDFFLIDDDHLAIVMADVSGKGIPAALFMMASKILINNFSVMEKVSPARILAEVNDQICKSNPLEMFVTVWLGILEFSTGVLKAVNAGHEYPVIKRAGGCYELYKDKHGFVLGGMEGICYKEYEVTLSPGDCLFQYTDGVTEATNAGSELFGTDRLLLALNKDRNADPKKSLENVKDAIGEFVKDAPQFDDITMLCISYKGPSKGKDEQ